MRTYPYDHPTWHLHRPFFYVTSSRDLVTWHLYRFFSYNSPMLPTAALVLHPTWCTHCVWLFLLYRDLLYNCELFSNCDLFTDPELHDKHTLALPCVMHALRVASSARSSFYCPVNSFPTLTLYWPWTPWRMHLRKPHHVTWCSFAAAPYVMHAIHVGSSAHSFLLYRELFSDPELFTDRELHDECT